MKPSRGRVAALSGIGGVGGLTVGGPIARSVADAALLLEGMLERSRGRLPQRWSLGAPGDGEGSFLGAAVRGEGRFQIGVLTASPWDEEYDIVLSAEARASLDEGTAALAELGHGPRRRRCRRVPRIRPLSGRCGRAVPPPCPSREPTSSCWSR